jgi:hypothetical protein
MPSIDPISAGVSAATGLLSGITGLFQKHRANQLEKQNVRPMYNIPQNINDNLAIAKSQANQGLPQYLRDLQNIGRNQNVTINTAQDRRGGLGAISQIQQGTNDANLNLDVKDAAYRIANMRNLMAQNQVYANYLDKQWDWNNKQKYLENAAAVRAMRTAGNANLNTGLNGIIGGAAIAANGMRRTGQTTAQLTPQQRLMNADWLDASYGAKPGWNYNALPYNDFKLPSPSY